MRNGYDALANKTQYKSLTMNLFQSLLSFLGELCIQHKMVGKD